MAERSASKAFRAGSAPPARMRVAAFLLLALPCLVARAQTRLPSFCAYPGGDDLNISYRRARIEGPEVVNPQGQTYTAGFRVTTITPDVVGILVRASRLKASEGDHPDAHADDHGCPLSDEDKVEYRWYAAPGLDPAAVFRGYDNPSGLYPIAGEVQSWADLYISFEGRQTQKEHRVTLTIWTTWDMTVDPTSGGPIYTQVPLAEVRFTVDRFDGPGYKLLAAQRRGEWDAGTGRAKAALHARWEGLGEPGAVRFNVKGKNATGDLINLNAAPLDAPEYTARVEDLTDGGIAPGSTIGVEPIGGGGGIGGIGGSSIITDPCQDACQALPAPTLLSASSTVDHTVDLSWTAVAGRSSYQILAAADTCGGSFTRAAGTRETSIRLTGLPGGAIVAYKVRAVDAYGCRGDLSGCLTVTVAGQPCQALPAPSGLAPCGGDSVTNPTPALTWVQVPGAVEYYLSLFRPGAACASGTLQGYTVAQSAPGVPVSWTVPAGVLTGGTSYSWRVTAYGDGLDFCDGPDSACCAFWVMGTGLPAPLLADPEDRASNQWRNPVLRWLPVESAASYAIEVRRVDCTGEVAAAGFSSEASWEVTPALDPGATYHWRVTPLDANGYEGQASECRSFTVGTLCM